MNGLSLRVLDFEAAQAIAKFLEIDNSPLSPWQIHLERGYQHAAGSLERSFLGDFQRGWDQINLGATVAANEVKWH